MLAGGAIAVNLVLVAVVYLALAYGAVTGLLAGTFGGLAQDALAGGIVGHRRHDEDDDRVRWSACSARSSTCRRRCRGW